MSKRHLITATLYNKKGRVIAKAVNNYRKSHPVQAHFAQLAGEKDRIYLHAEIAALLKAGTARPHSIFIERRNNDGPACAAPCMVCRRALEAWGVKHIRYT